jgi:hypothetical protein
VFYFLYGNTQVASAFLLSCFFANTRTANVTCWIWVLGSGLFASILMPNVFVSDKGWVTIVQFIPTFGAFRCVASIFAETIHALSLLLTCVYA